MEKTSKSLRQNIDNNDDDTSDEIDIRTIYINILKEVKKIRIQIGELLHKQISTGNIDEFCKIQLFHFIDYFELFNDIDLYIIDAIEMMIFNNI